MEMLQAKSRQHCQEQMIRAIISNVLWKLLKIYLVLLLGQIQNPRSLTYPKLWKIMEWTVEFMGKSNSNMFGFGFEFRPNTTKHIRLVFKV